MLTYELLAEDYVAFNRHHFAFTSASRSRWQRWRFDVLFALMIVAVFLLTNRAWWWALAVAIFSVGLGRIGGFVVNAWMVRCGENWLRKSVTEKNGSMMVGPHTLALTDAGLEQRNAGSLYTVDYKNVGRIEETADYVFVYVNAIQALVIPRNRVQEAELQHLLTSLRGRMIHQIGA